MKKLGLIFVMLILVISCVALTDSQMEDIWDDCKEWTDQNSAFQEHIENEGLENDGFMEQVTSYFESIYGVADSSDEGDAEDWWDEYGWYTEPNIEWILPWWWLHRQKLKYYNGTTWS